MHKVQAIKELREKTGYTLHICKMATDMAIEKYGTVDELNPDQVQNTIELFYHLAEVSGNMGMHVYLPHTIEEHIRQAFIWASLSHCEVPPILHMNHPVHGPNTVHSYNPFVIVVLTQEIVTWRDVS